MFSIYKKLVKYYVVHHRSLNLFLLCKQKVVFLGLIVYCYVFPLRLSDVCNNSAFLLVPIATTTCFLPLILSDAERLMVDVMFLCVNASVRVQAVMLAFLPCCHGARRYILIGHIAYPSAVLCDVLLMQFIM